jgi:hypothetical protein
MSLFEFVSVLASVLFAMAIAQILNGVARTVRRRAQVEWCWLHSLWLVNLFLFIASDWWSIWDFRELSWTFPSFFYLLIPPTLLFFAGSLLTPEFEGSKKVSLEEHFQTVRSAFMWVLLAFMLLVAVDGFVFGVEPLWNDLRPSQILGSLSVLGGALFGSLRWHRILAVIFLIGNVLALSLRFLPGAFGPGA